MEPILNSQLPEFSVQAFQNGAFKTVTNNDLKGKCRRPDRRPFGQRHPERLSGGAARARPSVS